MINMCGIMGIFNVQGAESLVLEGLRIMENRGRDGIGIATDSETRYSDDFDMIISPSANAIGHNLHAVVNSVKQPLTGKGNIVSNCEIYNWEDIKKKYGLILKNDSDLLFWMFEKNIMPDKIDELDGDYALAYWKNEEVIMARDIFGVKPLWYSKKRNGSFCFAFASEKKALEKTGFENVEELNPRKILFYRIKDKELFVEERDFFSIAPENREDYNIQKENVSNLLFEAVEKRIPDKKLGLLFSGGVDSSVLAIMLKRFGADFTCYVAALESEKEAEDVVYARKVAEALGLKLKVITITIDEIEEYLRKIVPLIEDSNVVKVGVAIPFYLCCEEALKDGIKVMFSGLGSEEIFAGYERHKDSGNVNKECYSGILKMYERDLYRDDVVTMANSVELRVPYLDKQLVEYSLKIPSKYKLKGNQNKIILRDVAKDLGLEEKFAERKKRAAQYGSRFDNAIGKLAKRQGYKRKSEYLESFYRIPNLKLGVLFSSGKDSTYAAYVMKKQNYQLSCLITIKSENPDSYMFHTPTIDVAEKQAEAMNIPIITENTKGEKEEELKDLEEVIKKAREEYEIQGIVTGAIFSDYQRGRIEKICEKLGLKMFSPLWHMNQEDEMREILNSGFEVVMTSVAAEGLSREWLMKPLTNNDVDKLAELNQKYKINVAGEGGEFETLVLDGPMFRKKVMIQKYDIVEDKNSARVVLE